MNWEQKWAALHSLAECTLRIRKPGDFYVSQNLEVGGDGVLRSEFGQGETPQQAIEDHWARKVENLTPRQYIVIDPMGENRRHFRWNGFMWSQFPVEKKP